MRYDFWGKAFVGILLIAVGVLFLLKHTGVIDVDIGYIFSNFWPLILIFFGLNGILIQRRLNYGWGGSYLWNLIIIAVGLVFLNNNLQIFSPIDFSDLFKFIVPIILIVLGLNMLLRPRKPPGSSEWDHWKEDWKEGWSAKTGTEPSSSHGGHWTHAHYDKMSPDGVTHKSNFIGDLHLGQDYWDLKPMNISHFIGDTELDLTKANIPYGETRINISAFIGDVKVFVPNDVQLEISVAASSFLGDINVFDRREGGMFRSMQAESPSYYEADKKLRINISMFIGDVRVKRVG